VRKGLRKAHCWLAFMLLLGCDTSREERLAALRREAGALPDEFEARAAEAFRRLPACPAPESRARETVVGLSGFLVPA
jgi:hypothetical protein